MSAVTFPNSVVDPSISGVADPDRVVAVGQTSDRKVSGWITDNPLASLIMAVGVGAGLGWLLKSRR